MYSYSLILTYEKFILGRIFLNQTYAVEQVLIYISPRQTLHQNTWPCCMVWYNLGLTLPVS